MSAKRILIMAAVDTCSGGMHLMTIDTVEVYCYVS